MQLQRHRVRIRIGRVARVAARIAAVVALLLALVPETHVHADDLESPSACASCAFAQVWSAATPFALVEMVLLVAGLVVAWPRLLPGRLAFDRPVGRAPPSPAVQRVN